MEQPQIDGDRYELVREIGAGGMGQVYEGYDRHLKRRIAVKLTYSHLDRDPNWAKRFLREAELMAQLSHPGMPAIHDAGISLGPPERPYLVMEFIEGITFDGLLVRHGPLALGAVAALGAQVAAVLAATHRNRIYHRDLKPSNLMLCGDGTVKVLDFGLAVTTDAEMTRYTDTGNAPGTPAFMAPEQIEGREVVPQTDLYALGLVLYELLTGDRVMTGSSPYVVWENQVKRMPPEIRRECPEVPADMARVIMSMLAKSPDRRPEDAAIVHAVLMRHADGLGDLPEIGDFHGPARMYAAAVSSAVARVPKEVSPARIIATGASAAAPPRSSDFSRSDIRRAIGRARDLAVESRYTRAIDGLKTVVDSAVSQLGARDADVVEARSKLAALYLDNNDFPAAAELFSTLIDDLTAERGPYDEQVMFCQRQLATCNVRTGDIDAALARLRRLHGQMSIRYGENDRRAVELGNQIRHIEVGIESMDRPGFESGHRGR
ncbi:serine/threonine-protein kinase [Nocardia macrotermitis]|uniref:Serine/threonine-protein kinase PknD n=1 Tax=Nocardia macrotermitis TaxID=2585198 RepID=A0A7K0CX63_9NOCA|nr:serine/threonine-protein kinase [Nocardia macrotermitis]MQY18085.1 Serine/threonine-protein kinase PknD [Nocardia macrotermitis]